MRHRLTLVAAVVLLLGPVDALFSSQRPLFRARGGLLALASVVAPDVADGANVANDPAAAATATLANAVATGGQESAKERKAVPRKADLSDWRTLWRLSKPDLPLICTAFASLLLAASGEVLTPALQSTVLNLALSDGLKGGVHSLRGPITHLTIVGVLTAVATGLRGFVRLQ